MNTLDEEFVILKLKDDAFLGGYWVDEWENGYHVPKWDSPFKPMFFGQPLTDEEPESSPRPQECSRCADNQRIEGMAWCADCRDKHQNKLRAIRELSRILLLI